MEQGDKIVGTISKVTIDSIMQGFDLSVSSESDPRRKVALAAHRDHLRLVIDAVRRGEELSEHVSACIRAAGLVVALIGREPAEHLKESVNFWKGIMSKLDAKSEDPKCQPVFADTKKTSIS